MKHILEVDGIFFEVGLTTILSDIYLESRTGEITSIFGRNGAGKSCLMNIIYGQLEVLNSSIRFDGVPIKQSYKNPFLIRYLPQFHFIPKSLSLIRVLTDFGLSYSEFEKYFPEIQFSKKTKIGDLSGGDRRLVEVYILIKVKTQFVILDEPFTQLMPLYIEKIKQIIREEKDKKGFIISDHLFKNCIDISDKIYVLKNGTTFPAKSIDDIERLGYI